MGSDWLAGPVCSDSLTAVHVYRKRHAPYLEAVLWSVLETMVSKPYQSEPESDPEHFSEDDRAEPVQS